MNPSPQIATKNVLVIRGYDIIPETDHQHANVVIKREPFIGYVVVKNRYGPVGEVFKSLIEMNDWIFINRL